MKSNLEALSFDLRSNGRRDEFVTTSAIQTGGVVTLLNALILNPAGPVIYLAGC